MDIRTKFRIGAILQNQDFEENEPWMKAREPKAWVVVWIIAGPLSILLGAFFLYLVQRYIAPNWSGFSFVGFPFIFLILLIVHELIHAIFHPDRGIYGQTIFGFWPSKIVFYAYYEGERTRENFLVCLIAPFVALSIIPLIIGSLFNIDKWWYSAFIILNAFSSSVDILAFISVLLTIPSQSVVKNNGWYTYWKKSHNPFLHGTLNSCRL